MGARIENAAQTIQPHAIAIRPHMRKLVESCLPSKPRMQIVNGVPEIPLARPITRGDVYGLWEAIGSPARSSYASGDPQVFMASVELLGSAGKMVCWGFNLPAGPPKLGGSCYGSVPGFPMLSEDERRAMPLSPAAHAIGVKPATYVCSGCYGIKGQYATTTVALTLEVRRQFVRYMLRLKPGAMAEVFTEAIRNRQAHSVRRIAKLTEQGKLTDVQLTEDPYFFRLHDCGDFLNRRYFEEWCQIGRNLSQPAIVTRTTGPVATRTVEVPPMVIWAPTRTWVPRGGGACPTSEDVRCIPPNLVVRPSAMHFREMGPSLGYAGYSSSAASAPPELAPQLATWVYPAYKPPHEGGAAKPKAGQPGKWVGGCCSGARGPGFAFGNMNDERSPVGHGCRACWTRPDLTVAYEEH